VTIALVTGAASGIGLATSKLLLDRGVTVALADVDSEAVHREAAVLDSRARVAIAYRMDVASTDDVNAVVNQVATELGSLDILVNCAGIINPGPSHQVADNEWEDMLSVHLGGTFRCSRAAFSPMAARGGAIVNVSSIAAHVGMPGRLSYSVAKAGIEALTRTLAVEWAHFGIRVNSVAPGHARTPMVEKAIADGLVSEEAWLQRIPLQRLADPGEIAAAIWFLASADSSYVTGQVLVVDGALTINGN
jgi:NAD(P)-dependent dehydrogenase (short-subunit alcohol dehydrogenase family)